MACSSRATRLVAKEFPPSRNIGALHKQQSTVGVQHEPDSLIFPVLEYKEAFDIFDANKDGRISMAELKQMMIQLGQEPTDEEVTNIMTTADTNGKKTTYLVQRRHVESMTPHCLVPTRFTYMV